MYHETELRNLYDRLGAQYPQYELSFSGDHLTISRLHSKAEVSRKGAELYANGTLYDQFTSDEVEDPDDLYELIELFFLDIQHFGMTQGNETYIAAQKKASKLGTRFLILAGALFYCLSASINSGTQPVADTASLCRSGHISCGAGHDL